MRSMGGEQDFEIFIALLRQGFEGHTSLSAINFNVLLSASVKEVGLPYEALAKYGL